MCKSCDAVAIVTSGNEYLGQQILSGLQNIYSFSFSFFKTPERNFNDGLASQSVLAAEAVIKGFCVLLTRLYIYL